MMKRPIYCSIVFRSEKLMGDLQQASHASTYPLYDMLITKLLQTDSSTLRKWLASSKYWPIVAERVFKCMADFTASQVDANHIEQMENTRKSVMLLHTELKLYDAIIQAFRAATPSEYDILVTKYRIYLQKPFYTHLSHLTVAAWNGGAKKKAHLLKTLGLKIAALTKAYDRALQSQALIDDAYNRLYQLLSTVNSLEDGERELDAMAIAGQLDPPFIAVMSKALSSINETSYNTTEVADALTHLYFRAQEHVARSKPPEVRIVKYLLTVEDPALIEAELTKLFGKDSAIRTRNRALSTPGRLLKTIEVTRRAYHDVCMGEIFDGRAAEVIKPPSINRLAQLEQILRLNFL